MYKNLSQEELAEVKIQLENEYQTFKNKGLKLDMSRGKPSSEQLDLSTGLLNSLEGVKSADGTDCRNYGGLDGIKEMKELFASILDVETENVIVGGNSSLNMMYDAIAKAMLLGTLDSEKPWCKEEKIKWLCPSPGYDRHFAICEHFGIEMITVENINGEPDMDKIEELVSSDEAIKGIWCVPIYSNPEGTTYSDDTVRRMARLKPKAKDFRIFWDCAYIIHHLSDTPDKLLNLLEECKATDNPNMVYMFASTSKITFAGSGVAVMVASKENVDFLKKQISIQTIGPDKINQLRHTQFLGDLDGVIAHMEKLRASLEPKFDAVLEILDKEIAPLGIGQWNKPNGGYFISFNGLEGCAKRIVALAKEAGLVITPAGATYPYGNDENDSNIRIAPSVPPISELKEAVELLCVCIKLASCESLLSN